jgi:hypothetical protein
VSGIVICRPVAQSYCGAKEVETGIPVDRSEVSELDGRSDILFRQVDRDTN